MGVRAEFCEHIGVVTRPQGGGDNKVKRLLALVSPAPLVSWWAFAGAGAAADGTGGVALRATAGAVAATAAAAVGLLSGPQQAQVPAQQLLLLHLLLVRGLEAHKKKDSLDSMLDARQLVSGPQTRLAY